MEMNREEIIQELDEKPILRKIILLASEIKDKDAVLKIAMDCNAKRRDEDGKKEES